jgi:hypothetical protein
MIPCLYFRLTWWWKQSAFGISFWLPDPLLTRRVILCPQQPLRMALGTSAPFGFLKEATTILTGGGILPRARFFIDTFYISILATAISVNVMRELFCQFFLQIAIDHRFFRMCAHVISKCKMPVKFPITCFKHMNLITTFATCIIFDEKSSARHSKLTFRLIT